MEIQSEGTGALCVLVSKRLLRKYVQPLPGYPKLVSYMLLPLFASTLAAAAGMQPARKAFPDPH